MAKQDDVIGRLYYEVVKKYELPVRNHLYVQKKIKELDREIGEAHAVHYLETLLRRDIRTEQGEFKPVLNESLDPYIKRIKIEDYFRRNKVVVLPTQADAAEREAKRQAQWDD